MLSTNHSLTNLQLCDISSKENDYQNFSELFKNLERHPLNCLSLNTCNIMGTANVKAFLSLINHNDSLETLDILDSFSNPHVYRILRALRQKQNLQELHFSSTNDSVLHYVYGELSELIFFNPNIKSIDMDDKSNSTQEMSLPLINSLYKLQTSLKENDSLQHLRLPVSLPHLRLPNSLPNPNLPNMWWLPDILKYQKVEESPFIKKNKKLKEIQDCLLNFNPEDLEKVTRTFAELEIIFTQLGRSHQALQPLREKIQFQQINNLVVSESRSFENGMELYRLCEVALKSTNTEYRSFYKECEATAIKRIKEGLQIHNASDPDVSLSQHSLVGRKRNQEDLSPNQSKVMRVEKKEAPSHEERFTL